jgi:SPP1 gp7 family putative phage head morphogenesis protein
MTTTILKFDATSAAIVKRSVSKNISKMKKAGQTEKLRKSARPLPPDTVERYYRRLLKDFINVLDEVTAKIIMPEVNSILKEADKKRPIVDSLTLDASYSDDIARMIREAKLKINEKFSNKELSNMARRVAARGDTFNKEQVSKVFMKIIGVDPIATEPWLKQEVKAFVKENVNLIKSISNTYLTQVEQVVTRGARSGYTNSEIAEEIQGRFNVSESRAEFIARDQVAKFNGDLTKLRYQNVGINRYEWSTSGDERVRDSHAEKDGNIYSFDDPPSDTGNPGDDFQCRCVAIPVFDEEE